MNTRGSWKRRNRQDAKDAKDHAKILGFREYKEDRGT
jgi:hypothetical protein